MRLFCDRCWLCFIFIFIYLFIYLFISCFSFVGLFVLGFVELGALLLFIFFVSVYLGDWFSSLPMQLQNKTRFSIIVQ